MVVQLVTVSLCMIVKNEEASIGRCLDSVADLVDEINIVDTGSTDRTVEIVSRYTDRIFHFEWIRDFAAARNFSFDQATQDYILWMDADDVLLERDREMFARLKETLDPRHDAVLMDYVLSRDPLGGAQMMTRRNRLVRRSKQYRWVQPIHEYMIVQGDILQSDIEITHAPLTDKTDRSRNLSLIQEDITRNGMTHRLHFYLASELMAQGETEEAERLFLDLLAGETANPEDHILACGTLSNYYLANGDADRALAYLLRTFQYDVPRSDYVCRIADWFEARKDWRKAIFWYEIALLLGAPPSHFGLMNKACWTWYPHVHLAICFGKIGELARAIEHNEKALAYYPEDITLLDNREKLLAAVQAAAETGGSA